MTVEVSEPDDVMRRNELGILMLAAWCNVPLEAVPPEWAAYPNQWTRDAWARVATAAIEYSQREPKLDPAAAELQQLRMEDAMIQPYSGIEPIPNPLAPELSRSRSERPGLAVCERCPSCGALNVFVRQPHQDARHHVECRICDMRGPTKMSPEDAVAAWNTLPRRVVARRRL